MFKLKKIPIEKMDKDVAKSIEGPSAWPPSFHVNDKQMPEIRNWKVGEKYQIMIEVEMKSFQDEAIADKPAKINASASFDILAYNTMDIEDMSDEEFRKYESNALRHMAKK